LKILTWNVFYSDKICTDDKYKAAVPGICTDLGRGGYSNKYRIENRATIKSLSGCTTGYINMLDNNNNLAAFDPTDFGLCTFIIIEFITSVKISKIKNLKMFPNSSENFKIRKKIINLKL